MPKMLFTLSLNSNIRLFAAFTSRAFFFSKYTSNLHKYPEQNHRNETTT